MERPKGSGGCNAGADMEALPVLGRGVCARAWMGGRPPERARWLTELWGLVEPRSVFRSQGWQGQPSVGCLKWGGNEQKLLEGAGLVQVAARQL